MIVEFIVIVVLGTVVAVTLTRTNRAGIVLATLAGTVSALFLSFALRPLPSWDGINFVELLSNRLIIFSVFTFTAAALGKWIRPQEGI